MVTLQLPRHGLWLFVEFRRWSLVVRGVPTIAIVRRMPDRPGSVGLPAAMAAELQEWAGFLVE
ncbi:hypothetical protein TIFTF001_028748 [Ficus carica]|uniref:Uncharacterized protein n=1 Tax=Ficus carica TaxID=3494 RepID=A0AA88DR09_FICCA|nr:hypothetical protein TIFTF001_028748 [Ficus carica]